MKGPLSHSHRAPWTGLQSDPLLGVLGAGGVCSFSWEDLPSPDAPHSQGASANPGAAATPSPTLGRIQGATGPICSWSQSWSQPGPGSLVVILNGSTLLSSSSSARE